MSTIAAFAPGDRVRTTRDFAELFPWAVAGSGEKRLAGAVIRMSQSGRVVVRWDGLVDLVALDPALVEPETRH